MNRWLRNVLGQVLPVRCFTCGALSATGPLCGPCADELEGLAPGQSCERCGLPLPSTGAAVCGACLHAPPPVERTVAGLMYTGIGRKLVQGLKFDHRLPLAEPLGQVLAQSVGRRGRPGIDLLVPVPLHRARLRSRGFNQATEIARIVGSLQEIPICAPWVCLRPRETVPQTDVSGVRARRRNVASAFAVRAEAVRGRRVAVVDDVMTTGATAFELARTLRAAGAARVEAWVCCRALARGR